LLETIKSDLDQTPLEQQTQEFAPFRLLPLDRDKENIFNIELMKMSMMNGCHDKEKMDNGHFSHQRESIIAIKPIDLNVSFDH